MQSGTFPDKIRKGDCFLKKTIKALEIVG